MYRLYTINTVQRAALPTVGQGLNRLWLCRGEDWGGCGNLLVSET